MKQTNQNTMQAVAIEHFGGTDTLTLRTLPIPEVGSDQVLIRVESAGVGVWDVFEREGYFAEMYGSEPRFPHVLGFEGAGTVAAVGEKVSRFREGERVYGLTTSRSSENGFYAEYTVVNAKYAWPIPGKLTTKEAGAMPVDAATALRGLRDVLNLQQNETLLIFGASGGIGHIAVQIARHMGARVLAVASGDDGMALAQRLGADAVVDGYKGDIVAVAREFAPNSLDAALVTAGGEAASKALSTLHDNGRVAYPNGVRPEPKARSGLKVNNYNADYDAELMEHLNRLIEAGALNVHIARTFSLKQVAEAHRALDGHYLGRLALRPS